MLNPAECREFLIAYYDGVMAQGLLQPLFEIAKKPGKVGQAALSWYELQLAGETPQASVLKIIPSFPTPVESLLALGFETSMLDKAILDIIAALKRSATEAQFDEIIQKYKDMDVQVICADCGEYEISKILGRARLERAVKVLLEQDSEGFLHQKFIGPKLVQVTEASIPIVMTTIEKTLQDCAQTKSDFKTGEESYKVNHIDGHNYMILGSSQNLEIRFIHVLS